MRLDIPAGRCPPSAAPCCAGPLDDVLAEIEAGEEAAEEAQKQARKMARERKKAELHDKYEDRKAHLREKLHIG
jgi:hypothetical protein